MQTQFSDEKLRETMGAALRHVGEQLDAPLHVTLWGGEPVPLGKDAVYGITIRSPGVVASLLKRPGIGNLVRQYAVGNITVEGGDIVTIARSLRARVKKRNIKQINKMLLLRRLWPFLFVRSQQAARDHDFGAGAARHQNESNKDYIQFHYDLGNEFYQLFLDPELQYSCAYFTDWGNTLEQAQQDKLEMICRKLRLKKGERLLDIGCGWGGLVCYAAKHYGVTAHGVTLSEEQYSFAKDKIRALGLEDKVTVEIRDYLTLDGTYDKIASIGMFEHIGLQNFPAYFGKIKALLAERGIVLNHGIARRAKADMHRALHKITPEKRMILKYIFPGSELSPIGHTLNAMEAAGLEIHDVEAWREHYARTCQLWCQRLSANKERAIALVGSARYNLWVAYLAGVSLGFGAGSILIFQTVASKRSKEKGPSGLPPTRADLYR